MTKRIVIEAATPKCPVGPNRPGEMEDVEDCGRLLFFNAPDDIWACPVHGNVWTPQSLTHCQGNNPDTAHLEASQ